MNYYNFSLAKWNEITEILELYHSLIGTPGCTWSLDYPNKEIVESDIEHNSLYILKDSDNRIISVAAAGADDELKGLHWTPGNPRNLARIGVLPANQNRGIGTIILQNVINAVKARDFDGIIMLVSKTNPSALALYDKNGFKRCGETFMYGIDFYCYELLL